MYWIPAQKQTRGRPKEGYIYGFKLNNPVLKNCQYVDINNRIILKFEVQSIKYNIIPVYLNHSNWEVDFLSLYSFLNEFEESNVMIIGDCNARIGMEQAIENDIVILNKFLRGERKAKDRKLGKEGKRFIELCDSFGLSILNGRVKGDEEGELTYISQNGSSTIDLCAVKGEFVKQVETFNIMGKIYTKHLPITVELNFYDIFEESREIRLLPKIKWEDKNKEIYKEKLQEQTINIEVNELDLINANLISGIKIAAEAANKTTNAKQTSLKKTQKWFDWECLSLRKKTFSLLNKYRKNNQEWAKIQYIDANKEYKNLCREKERNYNKNLALKLVKSRDSATFWKTVKEIKGNKAICGKNIKIEELANYFSILFNPPNSTVTIQYAERYNENHDLDGPITLTEMQSVLRKVKNNKAPGLDRVPFEFIKNAPETFLNKLLGFYNRIMQEGEVPQAFKKSIIFPIHKKGDVKEPRNYRAISFSNTISKIFTGILLNRVTKFVEENEILSEYQAGYRAGYSTADHIFTFTNIVKLFSLKKKKLYAVFIDFRSAFDHIDRKALFYKLSESGLTYKFLNLLRNLYNNTNSCVWDGTNISDEFLTTIGLKQGCMLSPTFFSIFIDDLVKTLPGGARIGDMTVKILLYADDLVILAESPETLQLMINRLSEYCEKWNLIINLEKTKAMIFQKGGRQARNEKWFYRQERIQITKEYKYLGVIFTPQMSMKKHHTERYITATKALNSTWKTVMRNSNVDHSTKYQIFKTVMRSTICYAAQVWGYQTYDQVEKLQRYFIKRLFSLPENTPNYMLNVETGLGNIYLYTFKLHCDYIVKVMSYEEKRLPLKVAKHILAKRELYIKEWELLAQEHDYRLDLKLENIGIWRDQLYGLLKLIDEEGWKHAINTAKNSLHRNVYNILEYGLGENNYFKIDLPLNKISTIFKTRGELLSLNYIPHKETETTICTLCNHGAVEDTIHLIAVCPIFKEIRNAHFRKTSLTYDEAIRYLNGYNWIVLADYIKEALSYRKKIITGIF